LGLRLAIGTQTVEQIYAKYHSHDEGDSLLNQFRSYLTFESSPTTYQWIQARLGHAKLLDTRAKAYSPDYRQSVESVGQSPVFDVRHPEFKYLRKAKKPIWGVFAQQLKEQFADADKMTDELVFAAEYREVATIAEINEMLSVPFVCLANVQRAGIKRRDYVLCDPLFADAVKKA